MCFARMGGNEDRIRWPGTGELKSGSSQQTVVSVEDRNSYSEICWYPYLFAFDDINFYRLFRADL